MIRAILCAFLTLSSLTNAAALTPAKSRIEFSYTQMGVKLNGQFSAFSGQLVFDPAKPQLGQARIEIKLASVDTGLEEANAEVVGKDWFNVAAFPVARFESTAVKALGGKNYLVDGRLTIKGRSQTIRAPFAYTPDGDGGLFTGSIKLKRADFAIGEGAWRDFSVVGNDIEVRFNLRVPR